MPKIKIPNWRYGAGVTDLIYLAEINFLICEKIYEEISSKQDDAPDSFLLLTANNCFYESLGIIHTLLCSTKDEELRIEPYLRSELQKKKMPILGIDEKKSQEFFKRVNKDYPHTNYLQYDFLFIDDNRLAGDIVADIKTKKTIESSLADLEKLKDKFEKSGFHKVRHQAGAHKNKHLDFPAGAANMELRKEYINRLGEIVKDLKIANYTWFNYVLENPLNEILNSLDKFTQYVRK